MFFYIFRWVKSRWPITWSAWFGSKISWTSITFVILSHILCGKVQKTRISFSAQDCVKVSPEFVVVSQIISNNWRKKRKILRDMVHTSVGRGNLINCREPRKKNFYTVLCRKYEGVSALYRMKFDLVRITKVMNDYPYLWCPITGS